MSTKYQKIKKKKKKSLDFKLEFIMRLLEQFFIS